MTFLFKKASEDKEHLISLISPKLIWLLRDFTLESVHPETGEAISSKEYLEICLKKKIVSKSADNSNLIRETIIKYFPNRECVTLSRPVDSEEELGELRLRSINELKQSFQSEFAVLKRKVYQESDAKILNGKPMTGPVAAHLLEQFVGAINEGAVPNINNCFDNLVIEDLRIGYAKAMNAFRKAVADLNELSDFEEVQNQLLRGRSQCFSEFNKVLSSGVDTFENKIYLSWFKKEKEMLANEVNEVIAAKIESSERKTSEFLFKKIMF